MVALTLSVLSVVVARSANATGGINAVWDVPGSRFQPGDPVVALTFDDGPSPAYTQQILDVLARYRAPATFFVVGRQAAAYPELVHAEAAAGDGVANHTWDHVDLSRTPASAYPHQVDDTTDVIEAITGWRTPCLRPPYGAVNSTVDARLADHGVVAVGWSVDPSDYRKPGADRIAERVLSNVQAGSIVELHDGGGDRSQTVAALPSIIEGIRSRGLEPVSLCGPPPRPPAPLRPPDFSGDGFADVAVWRPSNGLWFTPTQMPVALGATGDIAVPADYDGDGRLDQAVWRPSNGTWYIFLSASGSFFTYQFGQSTDVPVPADYTGDGEAELSVYRPGVGPSGHGAWFAYDRVANNFPYNNYTFGNTGDIAVPGPWTNDRESTIAVWRPSNGLWFTPTQLPAAWGAPGDIAVPVDYDGDGHLDQAVYRPSNGTWYIHFSTGIGDLVYTFGVSTDVPVPADYTGDGKSELAVYRPGVGPSGHGAWFAYDRIANNFPYNNYTFGNTGDIAGEPEAG